MKLSLTICSSLIPINNAISLYAIVTTELPQGQVHLNDS